MKYYAVAMSSEQPSGEPRQGRRGRWRTGEESRRRVLDAARSSFADRGYDRTTVRQIAAEAAVDPALVHYFYGTKARLFAAAMELPVNPADRIDEVLEGGVDGVGRRLARHFLRVWDEAGHFERMAALMRSAPTDDQSAQLFEEFIRRELVARFESVVSGDVPRLRAELVGTQLVGLAMARYVLRIEPLASADAETVADWVGPALQTYFTP